MKPGYTLAVRERGDWYVACLTLRFGKDMCMQLKARVSQSAIAQLLNKTFRGRIKMGGQGDDVMGFFGRISRAVRGVANKVARSRVYRTANTLMRNPMVRQMAMTIPGVGQTMATLQTANMGLRAARGIAQTMKAARLRPTRSQMAMARQRAMALKRRAFNYASRFRVPQQQMQQAWRSGFMAMPDPRLIAQIQAYRGPQNVQQMYRTYLPQAQRGYAQAFPAFLAQYGMRGQAQYGQPQYRF